MTLSRDHWDLLRSRHIWSLQESADQMGKGLMGLQSCPGEAEESWSGMPRVLAPSPHPTVTWPPGERGPWLIRRKRERRQNMLSWPPLTTSYLQRLKLLVFLVRRLRCSSGNSAAESGMSQESPSPTSISYREFQWRFNGETRQRCWGHLHQQNLILSTLSNSLNSACGTR